MKHCMKREIEHSGEVRMPEPAWQQQASRRLVRPFFAGSRGQLACSLFRRRSPFYGTLWVSSSAVSQRTLQGRFPPARLLRQEKCSRRSGGHVPTRSLGAVFFSELKNHSQHHWAGCVPAAGGPQSVSRLQQHQRDQTNSEDHQSSIPLLKNKDTALWVSPCQAAS